MGAVAIISDIHGNAVALEAVLADTDRRGVDTVVCLGDIVACGSAPAAVIDRLRVRECPCVLGNTDEWLLGRRLPEPHEDEYDKLIRLVDWGARAIGDEGREYLESLPPLLALELADERLLCFHGSPRSSVEPILAETPDDALAAMLQPYEASAYAGGHTHLQLVRRLGRALVVNAGSVGVALASAGPAGPTPPAYAHYAIVTATGTGLVAELCRVAVDRCAATAAGQASGMPYPGEWPAILARRVTRSNERARAAVARRAPR